MTATKNISTPPETVRVYQPGETILDTWSDHDIVEQGIQFPNGSIKFGQWVGVWTPPTGADINTETGRAKIQDVWRCHLANIGLVYSEDVRLKFVHRVQQVRHTAPAYIQTIPGENA